MLRRKTQFDHIATDNASLRMVPLLLLLQGRTKTIGWTFALMKTHTHTVISQPLPCCSTKPGPSVWFIFGGGRGFRVNLCLSIRKGRLGLTALAWTQCRQECSTSPTHLHPDRGQCVVAVPVPETIEAALPGEIHPGEGEEIAIKFGINFNSKTTP